MPVVEQTVETTPWYGEVSVVYITAWGSHYTTQFCSRHSAQQHMRSAVIQNNIQHCLVNPARFQAQKPLLLSDRTTLFTLQTTKWTKVVQRIMIRSKPKHRIRSIRICTGTRKQSRYQWSETLQIYRYRSDYILNMSSNHLLHYNVFKSGEFMWKMAGIVKGFSCVNCHIAV